MYITKCIFLDQLENKLCTCSSCQQTFISEEIDIYKSKITFNTYAKLRLVTRASDKIGLAGLVPVSSLTPDYSIAMFISCYTYEHCILVLEVPLPPQSLNSKRKWGFHCKFGVRTHIFSRKTYISFWAPSSRNFWTRH